MGAALAVLILVGTGERVDVSTRAVAPALEHAARRPLAVSVGEVAVVPDEDAIAQAATAAKADVVVEVGWRAPVRDRAIVRLHARTGLVLRASELEFAPAEPNVERGRAVGFAIATMLDDEPVAAIIASSAATEGRPAPAAEPSDAKRPGDDGLARQPEPAPTTAPTPATRSADRATPITEAGSRLALEATGSAVADTGGLATGVGPQVRLQWNVERNVGLRLGGGARWFSASGRSASELGAMTGISWTFARGPAVAAAARAEVGLLRDDFVETVARTNPQGKVLPASSVDRTNWAPSAALGLEGDWQISRAMAVIVAVSLEASTRAVTGDSVSRPSPMWAVLESGLRFSF